MIIDIVIDIIIIIIIIIINVITPSSMGSSVGLVGGPSRPSAGDARSQRQRSVAGRRPCEDSDSPTDRLRQARGTFSPVASPRASTCDQSPRSPGRGLARTTAVAHALASFASWESMHLAHPQSSPIRRWQGFRRRSRQTSHQPNCFPSEGEKWGGQPVSRPRDDACWYPNVARELLATAPHPCTNRGGMNLDHHEETRIAWKEVRSQRGLRQTGRWGFLLNLTMLGNFKSSRN